MDFITVFIGKDALHCTLEEPDIELGEFQEFLLRHNGRNTKKFFEICDMTLATGAFIFSSNNQPINVKLIKSVAL